MTGLVKLNVHKTHLFVISFTSQNDPERWVFFTHVQTGSGMRPKSRHSMRQGEDSDPILNSSSALNRQARALKTRVCWAVGSRRISEAEPFSPEAITFYFSDSLPSLYLEKGGAGVQTPSQVPGLMMQNLHLSVGIPANNFSTPQKRGRLCLCGLMSGFSVPFLWLCIFTHSSLIFEKTLLRKCEPP